MMNEQPEGTGRPGQAGNNRTDAVAGQADRNGQTSPDVRHGEHDEHGEHDQHEQNAQVLSRFLPDEQAVSHLAQRFGVGLQAPLVVWLSGDLGAGKTTFARALIHALGYPGRVKSPSYGLLETYSAGGLQVLHLDLYRIEDAEEIEYLAVRDLFTADTLLLVEWPNRGTGYLPAPDLELTFADQQEGRSVTLRAFSAAGAERLRTLGAE